MYRLFLGILFSSLIYADCTDVNVSDLIDKFDNLSIEQVSKIKEGCSNSSVEAIYELKLAQEKSNLIDLQRATSIISENGLSGFDSIIKSVKNTIKANTQAHRNSNSILTAKEIKKSYIHKKYATRGGVLSRGAKLKYLKNLTGVPIRFETGKYEIKEGINKKQIDELAKALKSYKDKKIYLTGFADTRGEADKNLKLSKQRAFSIKSYLVKRYGFDDAQIVTDGFGEANPICISGDIDKNGSEYSCTEKEDYSASRRVIIEVQ